MSRPIDIRLTPSINSIFHSPGFRRLMRTIAVSKDREKQVAIVNQIVTAVKWQLYKNVTPKEVDNADHLLESGQSDG